MRSYMGGHKNARADLESGGAASKAIPFFLDAWEDKQRLALIDYQGQEWLW